MAKRFCDCRRDEGALQPFYRPSYRSYDKVSPTARQGPYCGLTTSRGGITIRPNFRGERFQGPYPGLPDVEGQMPRFGASRKPTSSFLRVVDVDDRAPPSP